MVAPDDLQRIVTLLDARDFQVHMHTIGDRAVRDALDAVQAAQEANGRRDMRHHLAHLQLVHPDDLPRFAELGVVANVSPYWACRSGYVEELTEPFIGPGALGAHVPVRGPATGERPPRIRERLDGFDRQPAPPDRGRRHTHRARTALARTAAPRRRGSTWRPR